MANDYWRTPPSVIEYVERRWGKLGADLCASAENHLHVNFFSVDDSMLDLEASDNRLKVGESILFSNPPYSNPKPFVDKCMQLGEDGFTIIMLLNLDTSTKWFSIIDSFATAIHPITGGRIAFHNEDGEPIRGSNKAQVLVRFGGYGLQQWETIHINQLQNK